jgi:4-amino-4-deoxy-L-arabinose transferase-like glycosyltransferase
MMTPPKDTGIRPPVAIWLCALTVLAACVRIVGINRGPWWDEIYFAVVSVRKPLWQIVTVFPGDNQHPLYSILARLSVVAFGEHIWSLRLPALVFGVAAIPALYLLTTAVATRMEALVSAGFLAVSYHHVWFSQNARGYTALAFFAVLATFFLVRGIQTGRRGAYLAYGVAAALGVYTHLTMAFLVASHVLIVAGLAFADWKKGAGWSQRKYALQGFLLGGGLTLLFYAPILFQVQNFFLHRPSSMRGISTPGWALREALRVLSLGLGTWAVLAGAALVAACGAWSYWKQSRLVFALFALPAVLTALGALAARGTMYPRFYFFLIGFAVVILVRGLFVIPRWIVPARAGLLTAILMAILLAGSCLSLARNYRYPKQDFARAIGFIDQQKHAGDDVITVGAAIYPLREYYAKPWEGVEDVEKLRQICRQGPVWVLYTFPRYLEIGRPEINQVIKRDFELVRVFPGTVGDGDVYVGRYPRE